MVHDPDILAVDPTGGEWFVGGCYIFAKALSRYLGEKTSLWALKDRALEADLKGLPIHVVVRIEDCFLDADGAWSRAELLKEWARPWRRLELRPFDPKSVRTMRCPAKNVRALQDALEATFGEPVWLTEG